MEFFNASFHTYVSPVLHLQRIIPSILSIFLCPSREMSLFTLPFFESKECLPANLPSIQQIEASTDCLKFGKADQKVVRLAPHFVVKYGSRVSLEEGKTMLYVRKRLAIPAPRVYALFDNEYTKKKYIIMEYVPGSTLKDLWDTLSDGRKRGLCERIRRHIEAMRAIPSPGGYCSLDRKPLRHEFLRTLVGNEWKYHGPFDTETDFNTFILNEYWERSSVGNRHMKGLFYARHMEPFLQHHLPVFTHGDLQRDNIIVQIYPRSIRIAILDWENAGWYPSYWEYAIAVRGCGRFLDDWHYYVDHMLVSHTQEWLWLKTLMEPLW